MPDFNKTHNRKVVVFERESTIEKLSFLKGGPGGGPSSTASIVALKQPGCGEAVAEVGVDYDYAHPAS